jgi:tetrahydromethanopterin S-methyltransferase subunit G
MDDQNKLDELRSRMDSLETSLEIVVQRLSERMALIAAQVEGVAKRLDELEAREQRRSSKKDVEQS